MSKNIFDEFKNNDELQAALSKKNLEATSSTNEDKDPLWWIYDEKEKEAERQRLNKKSQDSDEQKPVNTSLDNTKKILSEIETLIHSIDIAVYPKSVSTLSRALDNARVEVIDADNDRRYYEYNKSFMPGDQYKVIGDFAFMMHTPNGLRGRAISIGEILHVRLSDIQDQPYSYGRGHLIFCDSNDMPLFATTDKHIIYLEKIDKE